MINYSLRLHQVLVSIETARGRNGFSIFKEPLTLKGGSCEFAIHSDVNIPPGESLVVIFYQLKIPAEGGKTYKKEFQLPLGAVHEVSSEILCYYRMYRPNALC